MATFFNQATLSYSGGTVNSNIASGEIIEVLSASKTAVYSEYTYGTDITYIINIVNSGSTAYNGLTITDDLGAYQLTTPAVTVVPLDYIDGSVKYFINGVLQATPTVTVGQSLVISSVNIPANSTATIAYTVRTNDFASPASDGSITNTATINGNGLTEITVTETVTASNTPYLGISKSVSPSTVAGNGQITYTFIIRNSGNTAAAATDNVIVTDTFNPLLSDITVTYNGTIWSEPTSYTYDEATGVFTTADGAITVPAATYSRNTTSGAYVITPGIATLTVTGTLQ